jgi:predicted glycosyltransferase involved in capsule biosynthesis
MTLTTITPYWNREEVLRLWLRNLRSVTHPLIHHLVYFVDESPPVWWKDEAPLNADAISSIAWKKNERSIGYYHNLGAGEATSEWIMKLDVDAFPNSKYFEGLLAILQYTVPKVWYNGGMFYLSKTHSGLLKVPLDAVAYVWVMRNRETYSASPYLLPAATNFICRRREYLGLGGCSDRFKGYGWEDYQQIYMLEKYQNGEDPLPGEITFKNVTNRCRDEISRPKAYELWRKNNMLCLLHRWHQVEHGADMNYNRQVLLDYIQEHRHEKH